MAGADLDRDLRSIHEARALGRAAQRAQEAFEGFSQEQVDAVVEAMAAAGLADSERLARLAHEETGFGNVADKVAKNNFVLEDVVEAMRGMRTVGVLREDRANGVVEIAEPVGVVAGIIPSTNPTSTAMFKCLIALKARCGIVLSPHPAAKKCILASAEVMHDAAVGAGAPEGIIGSMTEVTMDGTRELMNGRDTDLILATGGMALVKAAYSAGKPAYGVGPGNVPAYIERSADVDKAVRDIVAGTTFDYGTLCSSEQSIICDAVIADRVRAAVEANDGHFLSPEEVERLSPVVITAQYLVNAELVGRPAATIAARAGISVPDGTRVLVCPLDGVGKEYPLSHEKLSPVLAFYEVEDWRQGCERCTELLRFGGMGHTLVIHSQDPDVIIEFGLQKPAHRVLVNTMAALGAVGYTTNLFPSMTLGCGSWGNNITSDNIGPQHLVNVKRLAYETRPWGARERLPEPAIVGAGIGVPRSGVAASGGGSAGPGARHDDGLEEKVAAFLKRRGIVDTLMPPPTAGRTSVVAVRSPSRPGDRGANGRATVSPRVVESGEGAPQPPRGRAPEPAAPKREPTAPRPTEGGRVPVQSERGALRVADFVSEADVREALNQGKKIGIGPNTIITPLARELGRQHGVFTRR